MKNSYGEEGDPQQVSLTRKISIGELKAYLLMEVTDKKPFFLPFNMYNWETMSDLLEKISEWGAKYDPDFDENNLHIKLYGGDYLRKYDLYVDDDEDPASFVKVPALHDDDKLYRFIKDFKKAHKEKTG